MYSLHLTCTAQQVDDLSFALWEARTAGIREEERGGAIRLIAGFEDSVDRDALALEFAAFSPVWEREDDTDWVAATQQVWPGREIGVRVYLAPVWNEDPTPPGRVRVIHNPGSASGTGEHPCTQLALESLEQCVSTGDVVVDVGTGSGILSAAALRLGARAAIGLDLDLPSLASARENFLLNDFQPALAVGTADCIAAETADVVVANISGSVLLSLADELLRVVRVGGWLILTGFPESELPTLRRAFGGGNVSEMNEWRCLTLQL
jgi:ribosomal protein L11 methyltransferase